MEPVIHILQENLSDGRKRYRGEVILDPGGAQDKILYVGPLVCDYHAAGLDAMAWREEYLTIAGVREALATAGHFPPGQPK